jgi:xanthine/uracil/vitamin C permease (AzgA family)
MQKFGKFFKLTERRTTLSQEIRGGLVTFLTVAYILPVNSGILNGKKFGIFLKFLPSKFIDLAS